MKSFWKNLLIGAGSVFDLWPTSKPARFEMPRGSLADDWKKVTGDMDKVLKDLRVAESETRRVDPG